MGLHREELYGLMEGYGMLTDCFDFNEDFTKHVKFGFVRECLKELNRLDRCDYTVRAIDKSNETMKENILEHAYIKDIQESIIDVVLADIDSDMREILESYQKKWNQM